MPTRLTPAENMSFDLVVPSLIAVNHKQLIKACARELATLIGIKERILADRLWEKEKTTPSAIGDGIAIVHLHISGLQNPVYALMKCRQPVAMGAADNKQVDLICFILTPEREGAAYLRTMARISRLLRNDILCERLRTAADEKTMRMILDQSGSSSLAA